MINNSKLHSSQDHWPIKDFHHPVMTWTLAQIAEPEDYPQETWHKRHVQIRSSIPPIHLKSNASGHPKSDEISAKKCMRHAGASRENPVPHLCNWPGSFADGRSQAHRQHLFELSMRDSSPFTVSANPLQWSVTTPLLSQGQSAPTRRFD